MFGLCYLVCLLNAVRVLVVYSIAFYIELCTRCHGLRLSVLNKETTYLLTYFN